MSIPVRVSSPPSSRIRRATLVASALACALLLVGTAASAQTVPIYPGTTSDNVHHLGQFPDTLAISAEFALTGNFFYTSSTDSISAFSYEIDGDNVSVTLEGTMPDANFENESMTYGERRNAAGEVTDRFVIVAVDLVHANPAEIQHTHVGGGQVVIIDVTDPTNPHERSRGDISTSTHTVQCLSRSNCEFAYAVGDGGMFSIVDLRDLDAPTELAYPGDAELPSAERNPLSPASAPNPIFTSGSGHYWDIDDAGIAWHTGSGGAAAFDVSDPTAPLLLNATNEQGTASPWNDFILHNSMRPYAAAFDAERADGNEPDLAKGNILLVNEEDYFNDGDEVDCELTGWLQSWYIPHLDHDTYTAGTDDPFAPNGGTIEPLDAIHPVVEEGGGTATPFDGFCSGHWFDYHQTGIVAQGFYAAGLWFVDVRDPADLKVYGFATAEPSEVWDAYWFPVRDAAGVDTGRNTNFVMTADFVRGIDLFRVDLPEQEIAPDIAAAPSPTDGGGTTTGGTAGGTTGDSDGGSMPATGGGLALAALGLAAAGALGRRSRRP